MIGEMLRLLKDSAGKGEHGEKHISSFQAFAISLASRVGTGNLAGVATAIAIGGPGAIFWMWIIALLGASSAFVESTLAQLYKEKGKESFIGGPAYYMKKGLKKPWMGILFAILITVTFGFAFNSVQSNTICAAVEHAFGISHVPMGIILTGLTLLIIFGGIQRIAKVSSIIVPVMALGYVGLALVIVLINITHLPDVIGTIVSHAFGWQQALGGGVAAALMQGIKRGLFSNEAGYGFGTERSCNRIRITPGETRTDSDLRSFHRYSYYLFMHSIHHSFQWCSARWFDQRSTTHSTCVEQRNRKHRRYICGSCPFLFCV